MSKNIRIGLLIPIKNDPTSWYRGNGPFSMLDSSMDNLSLHYPSEYDWSVLKYLDILFMQRPFLPDHFHILMMAKENGKKIWIDIDDDNLAVPKDNPMYPTYNQPAIKESIVRMMRSADVVTVSTQFLKDKYDIYRPDGRECVLVPNALHDDLLLLRQIPNTEKQKLILWRGTMTHYKNLMTLRDELIKFAKEHQDWNFGFFGWEPTDITEHFTNFSVIPALEITNYHKQLIACRATCMYYSLARNDHAQSRSHVSWLEASFAGTPFVGPHHPEFIRPGTMNFETPKEWSECMEKIVKNDVDTNKMVDESWNCILENYMLSKVNKKREEIIENLISHKW